MERELALALAKMILQDDEHRDLFKNSVCRRRYTSVSNKDLHNNVLFAITHNNVDTLANALEDPWYAKPLTGVVFCMCDDGNVIKTKFAKFLKDNLIVMF